MIVFRYHQYYSCEISIFLSKEGSKNFFKKTAKNTFLCGLEWLFKKGFCDVDAFASKIYFLPALFSA